MENITPFKTRARRDEGEARNYRVVFIVVSSLGAIFTISPDFVLICSRWMMVKKKKKMRKNPKLFRL